MFLTSGSFSRFFPVAITLAAIFLQLSCSMENSEIVRVTGVHFLEDHPSDYNNGTVQLQIVVLPTNATNQNVSYSSSNPSVATVSETGFLTGVSVGETIITVTTQDGQFSETLPVTVLEGSVALNVVYSL